LFSGGILWWRWWTFWFNINRTFTIKYVLQRRKALWSSVFELFIVLWTVWKSCSLLLTVMMEAVHTSKMTASMRLHGTIFQKAVIFSVDVKFFYSRCHCDTERTHTHCFWRKFGNLHLLHIQIKIDTSCHVCADTVMWHTPPPFLKFVIKGTSFLNIHYGSSVWRHQ
jgi:hypothetical protein